MSVNKAILIGRLGQDPEVKMLGTGTTVCNFSIATDESYTDKNGQKQKKTEWHKIVVWGKTAEVCGQYLQKGKEVYVEGKIETREWQDKDGNKRYQTEIKAENVRFLGGGGGDRQADQGGGGGGDYVAPGHRPGAGTPPPRQGAGPGPGTIPADDIPF